MSPLRKPPGQLELQDAGLHSGSLASWVWWAVCGNESLKSHGDKLEEPHGESGTLCPLRSPGTSVCLWNQVCSSCTQGT